ncbi:acyl-CoA dehydrogenase family protein [Allokutzneria oryzae]|uniref:Acyl-CoA dehydrogenase family protein n=1 Tax=Allokutzneria oryzae TaxID=1378989 RepID=A0ABV6A705_9PSEU
MIEWNDEQRALRAAATALGEAVGAGHIERDERGEFDRSGWDRLREIGLTGLPVDQRWGGLGQDLLTTMYILEGLGSGCRDTGLSFSLCTHLASTAIPLRRYGSGRVRDEFLPRVAAGTAIGAHAITEPEAGSDIMRLRTTARREGDHFVLNGAKGFVSNGPIADLVVVYARTGRAEDAAGITAFLVERGTPGLSFGRPVSKMGLRTAPLGELYLDDCLVPADHALGAVGSGFLVLDHVMKWEILCSFVVNVGEMRHRLRRCVDYARTRSQFGKPIGSFQAVAAKLVEMKIGVESSAKWLYDTALRLLAGEDVTADLAIAKLVTSESNVASARAAVQLFGGYGYLTEYGVEKDLRDAVAGTIYSGTSEIQRERIAHTLGL